MSKKTANKSKDDVRWKRVLPSKREGKVNESMNYLTRARGPDGSVVSVTDQVRGENV